MQTDRIDIQLTNLNFYAHHGVLEQERQVGGHFRVTLRLSIKAQAAAVEHDQLSGTINYAEAYELVRQVMEQPSQLLEHVAGRILTACFERFSQLLEAEVEISKLIPPISGFDGRDCRIRLSARR